MIPRYSELPSYAFGVSDDNVAQRVKTVKDLRRSLTPEDYTYLKEKGSFKNILDTESHSKVMKELQSKEIKHRQLATLFLKAHAALEFVAELLPNGTKEEKARYERFRAYLDAFEDLKLLGQLAEPALHGEQDASLKLSVLVAPYRSEMILLVVILLEKSNVLFDENKNAGGFSFLSDSSPTDDGGNFLS